MALISSSFLTKSAGVLSNDEETSAALLSPQVGFMFPSAGELVKQSNSSFPLGLDSQNLRVLSVVPMGNNFAMWQSGRWNGDFEAAEAGYDWVWPGEAQKYVQTHDTYNARPLTYAPYFFVVNRDVYESFPSEDKEWLVNAAKGISSFAGQSVDAGFATVNGNFQSLGLTAKDFVNAPSQDELIESIYEALRQGDLGRELQCASGTCPCGGSNSCSKNCCGN